MTAITFVTWHQSAVTVPAQRAFYFWRIRFTTPLLYGIPVLALSWLLVLRGLPLRPGLVGLLCGLAGGLLVDASLAPDVRRVRASHVFASHLAAVVSLAALGAAFGFLWTRYLARW